MRETEASALRAHTFRTLNDGYFGGGKPARKRAPPHSTFPAHSSPNTTAAAAAAATSPKAGTTGATAFPPHISGAFLNTDLIFPRPPRVCSRRGVVSGVRGAEPARCRAPPDQPAAAAVLAELHDDARRLKATVSGTRCPAERALLTLKGNLHILRAFARCSGEFHALLLGVVGEVEAAVFGHIVPSAAAATASSSSSTAQQKTPPPPPPPPSLPPLPLQDGAAGDVDDAAAAAAGRPLQIADLMQSNEALRAALGAREEETRRQEAEARASKLDLVTAALRARLKTATAALDDERSACAALRAASAGLEARCAAFEAEEQRVAEAAAAARQQRRRRCSSLRTATSPRKRAQAPQAEAEAGGSGGEGDTSDASTTATMTDADDGDTETPTLSGAELSELNRTLMEENVQLKSHIMACARRLTDSEAALIQLRRRSSADVSVLQRAGSLYQGRGFGEEVPFHLRCEGGVQGVGMTEAEMEQVVRQFLEARLRVRNEASVQPISEAFFECLEEMLGDADKAMRVAYEVNAFCAVAEGEVYKSFPAVLEEALPEMTAFDVQTAVGPLLLRGSDGGGEGGAAACTEEELCGALPFLTADDAAVLRSAQAGGFSAQASAMATGASERLLRRLRRLVAEAPEGATVGEVADGVCGEAEPPPALRRRRVVRYLALCAGLVGEAEALAEEGEEEEEEGGVFGVGGRVEGMRLDKALVVSRLARHTLPHFRHGALTAKELVEGERGGGVVGVLD